MLRTAELLSPTGLSTLGSDPTRFQTEPPACHASLLAASRTALPRAGDDELMLDQPASSTSNSGRAEDRG
jgi:hypothetical protein